MQGWALVLGLAAGAVTGLAAAPDDSELQRCLRECGATSSGTDAETCRLQCRQQAEQGDAPIKHWKRTELKGGSPDPNVEGGSTTTVTERGPDGTTTTITKTDRAGRTTVKKFAGTDAERLAQIEGTGRVPFSLSRRLEAWCFAGCSRHATLGQRTSCRTKCPRATAVEPTAVPKPSVRAEPEAKPDPAACRSACSTRAQRCRDACPAANADRATCALQCNEGESSCRKRCG